MQKIIQTFFKCSTINYALSSSKSHVTDLGFPLYDLENSASPGGEHFLVAEDSILKILIHTELTLNAGDHSFYMKKFK